MTQDRARRIAERLLEAFGLTGWALRFVNFPPMEDEENISINGVKLPPLQRRRLGLCSNLNRTISLSIRHVEEDPDDYILETIAEEVAHAITPGDINHGPRWRRAYEHIKAILVADAEEQQVIEKLMSACAAGRVPS
jgi:hypothetical protein